MELQFRQIKKLDESGRYAVVGRKILEKKTKFYFPKNPSIHQGLNENTPCRLDKKLLSPFLMF